MKCKCTRNAWFIYMLYGPREQHHPKVHIFRASWLTVLVSHHWLLGVWPAHVAVGSISIVLYQVSFLCTWTGQEISTGVALELNSCWSQHTSSCFDEVVQKWNLSTTDWHNEIMWSGRSFHNNESFKNKLDCDLQPFDNDIPHCIYGCAR